MKAIAWAAMQKKEREREREREREKAIEKECVWNY